MNNPPEYHDYEDEHGEYTYGESPPPPAYTNSSPNLWTQFVKLFTPSTPEDWRRTGIAIVVAIGLMCLCSMPSLVLNYALRDAFQIDQFGNFQNSFYQTATAQSRICRAVVNQNTPVYTSPDITSTQITTMYPYGALSEAEIVKRKGITWVQIELPSGRLGWIMTTTISQRGSCSSIPIEY